MGMLLQETERAKGELFRGNQQLPRENIPTLADLGLTKRESIESQFLATLSDEKFEQLKTGDISMVKLGREAKKEKRENARAENAKLIESNICDKPQLNHYQTIVVDPPWDISELGDNEPFGRSEPTYSSMTVKEIINEQIDQYATPNCHLYLWGINRMVFYTEQVIKAWGFRYVTMLTWCKPVIGMGNYYRNNTEHIFFGIRGKLPLLRNDAGTWFQAKRGDKGHSSKPNEFYKLIETCSPGPRLDYFAREPRKGWDSYGAEL